MMRNSDKHTFTTGLSFLFSCDDTVSSLSTFIGPLLYTWCTHKHTHAHRTAYTLNLDMWYIVNRAKACNARISLESMNEWNQFKKEKKTLFSYYYVFFISCIEFCFLCRCIYLMFFFSLLLPQKCNQFNKYQID